MAKVQEQQLRDALVNVDYPAGKQDLIDHAVRNRADDEGAGRAAGPPAGRLRQLRMGLRSVDTEEATGQSPAEKPVRARQRDKPIAEHLRTTEES